MRIGPTKILFVVLLSLLIWWMLQYDGPSPDPVHSGPPIGIAEVVFEARNGQITRMRIPAKYKKFHNWSVERENVLTSSLLGRELYVCNEDFFPSQLGNKPCVDGVLGGGALMIELFSNNSLDAVRFTKENSVLPATATRDFKVINGLMSLGFTEDHKGRVAGKRYYKQATDGKVIPSWANHYYFIPADELEWPEYYMWCARINDDLTPKPERWCLAFSQVSPHVYVRYRLAGEHLSRWKEIDRFVKQIVQLAPTTGE